MAQRKCIEQLNAYALQLAPTVDISATRNANE
jgi:hypothetical protein